MDPKMMAVDLSHNKSNIQQAEQQSRQRTARSASHGRTPSASGVRSKIPMNVNHNRPPSSITPTRISSRTQDDSTNSIAPGNTTRRLTRSHNPSMSKSKAQSVAPGGMQKRWLENQFKKERKRYLAMKRELDEKQKFAQQIYDDMIQLRDKLIADGGKDPGGIEEIRMVSSNANRQSGDQNSCQINGETGFVINETINQDFIAQIESKLQNHPNDCLGLCEDVLRQHSEVLNLIKDLNIPNEKLSKETNKNADDYKKNAEIFERRLESGRKLTEEFNTVVMQNVKIMWAEIETSRWRIKHLENMSGDTVNELSAKLTVEMEKFNRLKEMKTTVDNELIKSKAKAQALETHVDASEMKIVQLQTLIKNLESQLKQNDINFERTTRDLHKSLKHSEEAIVSLETQRDDLLSRLNGIQKPLEKDGKSNDEMNARAQSIAKHLTADDIEHNEDAKKKVGELETLVNALREEVLSNKELVIQLQNEKSSREIQLKEQLTKDQLQLTKLRANYEELKKEHESLQQKFNIRESEMAASHHNDDGPKNIEKNLAPSEIMQSRDSLLEELSDTRRRNKELETQLQQQLKNLEMKNRMIGYLRGAHSDNTNFNALKMGKGNDSKAEVLQELCETLETKQMQLTHLENVLKQMEGQEMRNQEQRTRYEKRIAQLEFDAQMRKNKDCRYVMDFSVPHSCPKQNEVEEALELERKYQRLKRESWQMENIYNKLMESTIKSMKSRDTLRVTRGSNRGKEYTRRSPEKFRRVNAGCHVHQIVDQSSKDMTDGVSSTHNQKNQSWNRAPHRLIGRNMSSKREFGCRVNH